MNSTPSHAGSCRGSEVLPRLEYPAPPAFKQSFHGVFKVFVSDQNHKVFHPKTPDASNVPRLASPRHSQLGMLGTENDIRILFHPWQNTIRRPHRPRSRRRVNELPAGLGPHRPRKGNQKRSPQRWDEFHSPALQSDRSPGDRSDKPARSMVSRRVPSDTIQEGTLNW